MTNQLARVKGIVDDFDGNLYRFPAPFYRHCDQTALNAVKTLNPDFDFSDEERLIAMCGQSYRDTGSSLMYLCDEAQVNFDQANELYHQTLWTDMIKPLQSLPETFNQVASKGIELCIATHSHRAFMEVAIPNLGLDSHFECGRNVLTLEMFGFERRKCQTPDMVIEAAHTMGLDLKDVAFREDTLKNFNPKQFGALKDHGVTTILTTWGRTLFDKKPAEVDHVFNTPSQSNLALVDAWNNRPKIYPVSNTSSSMQGTAASVRIAMAPK